MHVLLCGGCSHPINKVGNVLHRFHGEWLCGDCIQSRGGDRRRLETARVDGDALVMKPAMTRKDDEKDNEMRRIT